MRYIPETALEPLFPNVDIRVAEARYKVQLELPGTSTLRPSDIERICAIATWDQDPGELSDRPEGGRGVVFDREEPIEKHGLSLGGVLVSGIGYRTGEVGSRSVGRFTSEGMQPPSSGNFMDSIRDNGVMCTTYAVGRRIVNDVPSYSPLGTYTTARVKNKVKKTQAINARNPIDPVVPHIEAYGRFIDDDLADEDGHFGFVVIPVPHSEQARLGRDMEVHLTTGLSVGNDVWIDPGITRLMHSLRHLHEEVGYAHLQAHLSNLYPVDGRTYMVDWSTSRRLPGNGFESDYNKAVDVGVPYMSMTDLLWSINNGELRPGFNQLGNEIMIMLLNAYTDGNIPTNARIRGLVTSGGKSFNTERLLEILREHS